ncbi:contact-dependent growth inhibition system immunity protein [Baaleninema simplex]|uniref:contact-dependent growth inhibition system immunity protein n=1 Tax=Baaleninema simplex TaxID=2862350 RepID=UPI001181B04C|nr:contact-dependent growth inhibition system immunity protein [Baaleninema simplex]
MTRYRNIYPELKQFFSGYFHQDWTVLHDWKGKRPSFEVIVHEFKTENPQSLINLTVNELESFLDLNLTEADLDMALTRELGSCVYAPGMGLTYRQWLEAILAILKESAT